jgi:hypothetical protein
MNTITITIKKPKTKKIADTLMYKSGREAHMVNEIYYHLGPTNDTMNVDLIDRCKSNVKEGFNAFRKRYERDGKAKVISAIFNSNSFGRLVIENLLK